MIIGAGPAGLAAAAELAERGFSTVVIDEADAPGGLAGRLACKATDACARCGACLVEDLIRQAGRSTLIELRTDRRLTDFKEDGQGATVGLASQAGPAETERVSAVIVAVGAGATRGSSRYGYGQLANVITGLELENMVREKEAVVRPSDGAAPGRVAFIQCVGSRDVTGAQPACSRVCCGYALRLARKIKALTPETEISVFYMDIQTFGRDMDAVLDELENEVAFIRALPGLVKQAEGDALTLTFKPEGEPDLAALECDLLVLSVGLAPRPGTAELAALLSLDATDRGFLIEPSERPILVAGTAGGPMGVAEAVRSGRLAAGRAVRRLGRVAEVA